MNYYEFERLVVDNILDYLPESFVDAKVSVQDVCKLGSKYKGLTIIKPGEVSSPVADLDAFYEGFVYSGRDIPYALREIAEIFKYEVPQFDVDKFQKFNAICDKLFIRLSRAGNDALADSPHRIIGGTDLAITYHVEVSIRGDGEKASFIVTNTLANEYGVSEEDLYKNAINCAPRINPAHISTLAAELGLPEGLLPIYLITTKDKVYGAASIAYPGVLDDLFHMIGSFFILPSSIHEVLLVPDDGRQDVSALMTMVREVNRTQVIPKERLSNNVYHYNGKELSVCRDAEGSVA